MKALPDVAAVSLILSLAVDHCALPIMPTVEDLLPVLWGWVPAGLLRPTGGVLCKP